MIRMIYNLFPQPVGVYHLDRKLTHDELEFIRCQDTRSNQNNLTSQDNHVLNRQDLSTLREFIQSRLDDYLETVYAPSTDIRLQITQSWINYTGPGQTHHTHNHPNSFVSGVFYPQADKSMDKIQFHRRDYQQIRFAPKGWNTWNSELWWFEVGTGDLLLFPSGLDHGVRSVESDRTRISLSFNTFPTGNIGEEISLTALRIGDVGDSLD